MAVITWPSSARIANITWSLDRPAQINRSRWSGEDQVIANPWYGRWRAEVELAPIVGEANVRAWRAFLALLKGSVNTFRLPAVEQAQYPGASPQANGTAAAGASTLQVYNFWPFASQTIPAGTMFTVNDELKVVTADAALASNATATLSFQPPLRAAVAVGAAITVNQPTALVALTTSTAGWSVGPGQVYGISLTVEERY